MKVLQETGRSMVEMLGVLAVIGVLSIAGIKGYTSAMAQHKANEAQQFAEMARIQLEIAGLTGNKGRCLLSYHLRGRLELLLSKLMVSGRQE